MYINDNNTYLLYFDKTLLRIFDIDSLLFNIDDNNYMLGIHVEIYNVYYSL